MCFLLLTLRILGSSFLLFASPSVPLYVYPQKLPPLGNHALQAKEGALKEVAGGWSEGCACGVQGGPQTEWRCSYDSEVALWAGPSLSSLGFLVFD